MFDILRARFQQKYQTLSYPDGPSPTLPDRFQGRPVIQPMACVSSCSACVEVCPTGAIDISGQGDHRHVCVDLGRCLFCGACESACPAGIIRFERDHQLAVSDRQSLVVDRTSEACASVHDGLIQRVFGRSLKLRQVSAGGCNACEADANVLGTLAWDMGRFGIEFVASPRHADGLLVTGPVTENMREALIKTYEAVPSPKVVIAVGACAISGGLFVEHPEVYNGVEGWIPVDLYVPGCPPHPLTLLDGLLRLLGRID